MQGCWHACITSVYCNGAGMHARHITSVYCNGAGMHARHIISVYCNGAGMHSRHIKLNVKDYVTDTSPEAHCEGLRHRHFT